jgi:hypothetical protein
VSTNLGIDQISSDWRDLLSALATEGVRFLMIGGYAVMRYTEPYHTKDLDLWVDPSPGKRSSREPHFTSLTSSLSVSTS